MLLCVCVILLVASDRSFCLDEASLNDQWEQWKITHGKKYSNHEEEEHHRTIWEKNMLMIHMHNQEADQGKHSYKLQMNQLGDMDNLDNEILEEMSEIMDEYDLMSRKRILKAITEMMEETDRITRYHILKEMDEKMVQNVKISRYHVLDEMAEKMLKYSKMFKNHILTEMAEEMAESNMDLKLQILDALAVMLAEYNGISSYHQEHKDVKENVKKEDENNKLTSNKRDKK
ncbi:Cathepsin L1 [Channa argus]|uniref:Cathepsin L1 n=1 Tax=Channa argus TaxID=215402 RepID=A0A6G1PQD9_CHAAH|nr:Cathepsin L1 [Channa argus]